MKPLQVCFLRLLMRLLSDTIQIEGEEMGEMAEGEEMGEMAEGEMEGELSCYPTF